jgi:hypothetical protein
MASPSPTYNDDSKKDVLKRKLRLGLYYDPTLPDDVFDTPEGKWCVEWTYSITAISEGQSIDHTVVYGSHYDPTDFSFKRVSTVEANRLLGLSSKGSWGSASGKPRPFPDGYAAILLHKVSGECPPNAPPLVAAYITACILRFTSPLELDTMANPSSLSLDDLTALDFMGAEVVKQLSRS